MLFAVVYFSQGMYYVFAQPLTLSEGNARLSATQIATFGWITPALGHQTLVRILSDSGPALRVPT